MSLPILIVGQGLAGSCLAWRLIRAGQRCLVVDRPLSETASRVAAGLVNPLTGRKIKPDWRQEECLAEAHRYYAETEQVLGGRWWQCTEVWRELQDEDQRAFWKQRREESQTAGFAGPLLPWLPTWRGEGLAAITYGAAVLHAESLVNAQRAWLIEQQCFEEAELTLSEIVEQPDGSLRWRGRDFRAVVWCVGFETAQLLDAPWLESRLSQGCILDLRLVDFEAPDAILHYGHWLVRQHEDVWRLGASYDWLWAHPGDPSGMAVAELLHGFGLRYTGAYELLRARAAVRPIIRYSQPVAGAIPRRAGHYMLGGLGSRGCTTAPWVSAQLAAHLIEGASLPEDLLPDALLHRFETKMARLGARA